MDFYHPGEHTDKYVRCPFLFRRHTDKYVSYHHRRWGSSRLLDVLFAIWRRRPTGQMDI